jgi:RNA polymerase sigma-70 factor (ECF subfamily)
MNELLPNLRNDDEPTWDKFRQRLRPMAIVQTADVLNSLDADTVQDVISETMLRVRLRLGTLEQDKRFSAWVRSICRHVCLERLRSERGEKPLFGAEFIDPKANDPLEELISSDLRKVVADCVAALEEGYRRPLILFYTDDLSQAEIGERMGLAENTVKQRLFRARQQVGDCVARKGDYDDLLRP